MPVAGTVDTAEIVLEVFGPDTQATLVVTPPTGAPYTVTATPTDDTRQTWRARVPLPLGGLYRELWMVTGTGEATYPPLIVAVGPADVDDPRHTYATTTDLANALHAAPPADAEKKLRDATQLVDDLLLCAVYPVDVDGMPTDPDHEAALRDAVCEVVKWWEATGDDGSGASAVFQSASIAGVSLGRASSKGGPKTARVGPAVRPVLEQAGLWQGPWY